MLNSSAAFRDESRGNWLIQSEKPLEIVCNLADGIKILKLPTHKGGKGETASG